MEHIMKSFEGLINQEGGKIGEIHIAKHLKSKGYEVIFAPKSNTKAYDLLAGNNENKYMIQVKTDVNGNGKCPKQTKVQKENLINFSNDIGFKPILVEYYPKIEENDKRGIYYAKNITDNSDVTF